MRLGFYYHTPIVRKRGGLYTAGYLGVFLDSLSANVETLTLVMHEETNDRYPNADYKLLNTNIRFVSLGRARRTWSRTFFSWYTYRNVIEKFDLDCFLVRSPTPLANSFKNFLKDIPVYYLIVGDYLEGSEHLKRSTFRDRVIYRYLRVFDFRFSKTIAKSKIIVNSGELFMKYDGKARSVSQIITSTISQKDINLGRSVFRAEGEIKLLFTGRIDPAKGLFELLEATALLNLIYSNVTLHIVGWEDNLDCPIERKLKARAQKLGISKKLIFHGKKKVGQELFSYYRKCDLFILPSYHEGFPRTIWEAMANGLPVIVTRVGGIPYRLENAEVAFLIPERNIQSIVDAASKLIDDSSLRNEQIQNAYKLVSNATLETQTMKLISILNIYNRE